MKTSLQEAGTFLIAMDDFVLNFTHVNICRTVNTNFLSLHHQWNRFYFFGEWKKSYNRAGGCINYKTWHKNPQYRLKILQSTTVIISIQQKEARLFGFKNDIDRNGGLSISFHLFRIENNRKTRIHVPMDSIETKTIFSNSRQITFAGSLQKGSYMIVPCTFTPSLEGKFLLQVYTFNSSTCKEVIRDVPQKKLFHSSAKNALSIIIHDVYVIKQKGIYNSISPYVKVSLEGSSHKTSTKSSKSVDFNEGFLFYPKKPKKAVIKLECYHSGILLDTFLGSCCFSVHNIAKKTHGVRYIVKSPLRKDRTDWQTYGFISFSIYFHSHVELL